MSALGWTLAVAMSGLLCFSAGLVVALIEIWWPRWNLADLASRLMLSGMLSFVLGGILVALVVAVTR